LKGLLQAAAKCFYAYIGFGLYLLLSFALCFINKDVLWNRFDAIASTGEEVLDAKRNIPLSIIVTLIVVSVCYISVSAILTLMIPYYMLDVNVPLSQAFDYVGFYWMKYILNVGAIASLITCLYGLMFPSRRKLVFRWNYLLVDLEILINQFY